MEGVGALKKKRNCNKKKKKKNRWKIGGGMLKKNRKDGVGSFDRGAPPNEGVKGNPEISQPTQAR